MEILPKDENSIHLYGLIRNPDNRDTLLNVSRERGLNSFPVISNSEVITVLNIQNEFVYCRGNKPHGIREYNRDLQLFSSIGTARWRFKEIEYKFNILNKEEFLYQLFPDLTFSGFAISRSPQLFHSVETMFYPHPDSYFSLLKWEDETTYNAIKIKKTVSKRPILTRDTLIVDYSPHRLSQVFTLFGIDENRFLYHSSTFIKKKQRHIAVDCDNGFVYGVSYNISRLDNHLFCQVEIEFWSKIVPQTAQPIDLAGDSATQLASHEKLIKCMCHYLSDRGISFNIDQIQKKEWLQTIAASKRK